jgi:hypothetical protein
VVLVEIVETVVYLAVQEEAAVQTPQLLLLAQAHQVKDLLAV